MLKNLPLICTFTAAAAISVVSLTTAGNFAQAQRVELPMCNEDKVLNHMSYAMDDLVDKTLNGLWNYILVNMVDDLSDVEMDSYRVYETGSAELNNVSELSREPRSMVCRATVHAIKVSTGIREKWGIVHYTIFENPKAQEGITIMTDFPAELEDMEDS